MKIIGRVILIALLVGLLQKAVEMLLVVLALAWIYGAIVKPAETFGLLFLLTLASCIRAYPGWSLACFGLLSITALIAKNKLE